MGSNKQNPSTDNVGGGARQKDEAAYLHLEICEPNGLHQSIIGWKFEPSACKFNEKGEARRLTMIKYNGYYETVIGLHSEDGRFVKASKIIVKTASTRPWDIFGFMHLNIRAMCKCVNILKYLHDEKVIHLTDHQIRAVSERWLWI